MRSSLSRRDFIVRLAAALGSAGAASWPAVSAGVQSSSEAWFAESLRLDVPVGNLVAKVEEALPALLESNHVPGLSVALIREGEVAWSGAYGLRSSRTGEPVETTTLFEAASLTKPVFAAAVMTLVQEGKLELDRPLGDTMKARGRGPYVEDAGVQSRLESLTPRLILVHRTGLPNWRDRQGLRFIHEPDTQWGYSGEGYVYLQRVVEALTGQSMVALLRERVFGPLGMERTRVTWRAEADGAVAESHTFRGESRGKKSWDEAVAASSIHTTPGEYARFMAMFMESGPSTGFPLSRESIAAMLRPGTAVDDWKVAGVINWGLGWGLQCSSDGEAFWHWGNNQGFKAFCIGYPKQGIGVAVFTNADRGWKVHREIVPKLVGGDSTALMWKV